MSAETEDTWPMPIYNVGPAKHLHALGVIAILFSQLERSVDDMYINRAIAKGIPKSLLEMHYLGLAEDRRSDAIRAFLKETEEDKGVIELIDNLLKCLAWSREARNNLLHSEQFPPSFGGDPNHYYLTKRISRRNPVSGYIKFSLEELRFIADQMRAHVKRSAEIFLYLRVRGKTKEEVAEAYWPFMFDPLPPALDIPPPVKLEATPP